MFINNINEGKSMEQKQIEIFISYSHEDENKISSFEKYFEPIKNTYNVCLWRDTEILAGSTFQKIIEEKLTNPDIILLFVSDNFLSSQACKDEMKVAFELKENGVIVIPIILSTCLWKVTELKDLLAVPTDGKPVSDFDNENKAWEDIYQSIKKHIEYVQKFNSIIVTDSSEKWLQDTQVLTNAHHNKEKILLDDIFVCPQLECYDDLRDKMEDDIEFSTLEDNILEYKDIVIIGEDQSGKTVLCKRLFTTLRDKKKLPVYIHGNDIERTSDISQNIKKAFYDQYKSEDLKFPEIKDRIIPIIDDFHKARNKQKIIENIENMYGGFSILVIDDISGLNIQNKEMIRKFKHFRIKEYIPSQRYKLIEKWSSLTDDNQCNDNKKYQQIDKNTELVNTTLGKVIDSNGIIPSYPFFILTILSQFNQNSLDTNITSQGHCYQALIYILLRKEVKKEDIDIYLNFLTEIAYFFLTEKIKECGGEELDDFIEKYQEMYNLPIKPNILLQKLDSAKILVKSSFGTTRFYYDYIYFYFVAKFLSESINKNESKIESKNYIENMIDNLHKNENAYIIIFISHHLKDDEFIQKILSNADNLFEKYPPSHLRKDEVGFLDEYIDFEFVLPGNDETVESTREEELKKEDKEEELQREDKYSQEVENTRKEDLQGEDEDRLSEEIRKTIRTVEVMGRIIKNRSGSLRKSDLEEICKKGMQANLRLLNSFIDFIKDNDSDIQEYIKERLYKVMKEANKEIPKEKLREIAIQIFYNLVFGTIFGVVHKTAHSLGSDNLRNIISAVCDHLDTPVSFLIKHSILMWYSKELQIVNISKNMKDKDKNFSKTAEQIIKYIVFQHCRMHTISYKDKDKLVSELGFKRQHLFPNKK